VSDAVIEWFDSHCHLQAEFSESGGGAEPGPHATRLAAVMARASEAGVTRMVCVGTGAGSSEAAVHLVRAMRQPGSAAIAEGVELWATVGLHPHDAVDGVDSLDGLLASELEEGGERRADQDGTAEDGTAEDGARPVVVAIGECGLDYHYDHSPRAVQREAFALQVELAHRHGLALVIHTREAWDDTFDILAAGGVPERAVVHCFTGGPDEARRCLDLGASISFSGVVTFKNAADVREAAALCPMDRLLVETDTPFLTPVPHRGTLNEPSRVPLIGAAIALVKGIETSKLAEASTRNARVMFAL
jgi:TatD DNase family protein